MDADEAGVSGGSSGRKRRRTDASSSAERRSVSFGHVAIRSHRRELFGGGGVPGDEGVPLGLSWQVLAEDSFPLDAYEREREKSRTPKDQYCMVGGVPPEARRRMLQRSGSTEKEMRVCCRAVEKLNRERWAASAMLLGNAWLFRSSMEADTEETLSMLGVPDAYGVRLRAREWHDAASFAKALARPLNLAPERLLRRSTPARTDVSWPEVKRALQGWMARGHTALLVDCDAPPSTVATAVAVTPPYQRRAKKASADDADDHAADDGGTPMFVSGLPPPDDAFILDAGAVDDDDDDEVAETDVEGDADDEADDEAGDDDEAEATEDDDEGSSAGGSFFGGGSDPSFYSPKASMDDRPIGLESGGTAATLLARLVASVQSAYVATHSDYQHSDPSGGSLSVVLRGWRSTQLTAEWTDDEPDEMVVGLLE